jgi:hypothetical protein
VTGEEQSGQDRPARKSIKVITTRRKIRLQEDDEDRATDEPEERRKRSRPPEERDADDEKAGIHIFHSHLQISLSFDRPFAQNLGLSTITKEGSSNVRNIKALLRDDLTSNLDSSRIGREPVDSCEATDEESEGDEEEGVGEESVDGEESDDDGVVAGEVACVVRYSLERVWNER